MNHLSSFHMYLYKRTNHTNKHRTISPSSQINLALNYSPALIICKHNHHDPKIRHNCHNHHYHRIIIKIVIHIAMHQSSPQKCICTAKHLTQSSQINLLRPVFPGQNNYYNRHKSIYYSKIRASRQNNRYNRHKSIYLLTSLHFPAQQSLQSSQIYLLNKNQHFSPKQSRQSSQINLLAYMSLPRVAVCFLDFERTSGCIVTT